MLKVVCPEDINFYESTELDIFARTLWGAARYRSFVVRHAVASVIINRVEFSQSRGPHWWGNNIIQVCQKPYQFQAWDRSSPYFQEVMGIGDECLEFRKCLSAATRARAGELKDCVKGATHFLHQDERPYWADRNVPTARIENLRFYKLD